MVWHHLRRLWAVCFVTLGVMLPLRCMHCTHPTVVPAVPLCRGKTNFFEKRVGEYQKSGVMAGLQGDLHSFQLDADF